MRKLQNRIGAGLMRWKKIESGRYATEDGRFFAERASGSHWILSDTIQGDTENCRTLTECKETARTRAAEVVQTAAYADAAAMPHPASPEKATSEAPRPVSGDAYDARKPKSTDLPTPQAGGRRFTVYTDGGCFPNPGCGGVGIVIIDLDTGIEEELYQGYKYTTNNRMEVLAMILALERIPDDAEVELCSDSQYALQCGFHGWGRGANMDLWPRLDAAARTKKITTRHVRGHTGDQYNERCDELATLAQQDKDLWDDDGFVQGTDASAAQAPWQQGERRQPKHPDANAHISKPTSAFLTPLPDIPPAVNGETPDVAYPMAYAVEFQVSTICAAGICEFYKDGRRSFAAYAQLRSGGFDRYSSMSKTELLQDMEYPEETADILHKVLNGRDVLSALRWRCRGLTLTDSIRKVQADAEISTNAFMARYKKR